MHIMIHHFRSFTHSSLQLTKPHTSFDAMGTYVAPGLRATHKLVAPSEPQGLIDPDELTHGLVGPPLYTIMADEVERSSVVAAKFEDVELVGSYSWIKGEKPAILVPGRFSNPRYWASRESATG